MDLTHRFTVPTPVDKTWGHFQDIASVAECFPGATVSDVEGDTFRGTCKVKLGPIAMVYTGSGTFVQKDEAAHRFVVEAKGKDKRGNGTAGATVTLSMSDTGGATDVEVLTDLAITGKPAQFGRGVMQDVSDKLLGQFVSCLEERLGRDPAEAVASGPAPAVTEVPPLRPAPAAPAAPPAGPGGPIEPGPAEPQAVPATKTAAASSSPRHVAAPPADGDVLNLGATVLPVLVRSYGRQVAAVILTALALWWLVRRGTSRR